MMGSNEYSSSSRAKSAKCTAKLNQLASPLEYHKRSPKIGTRRHSNKSPTTPQDLTSIKSESRKKPVDTPNKSQEQNPLDHEHQQDHLNSHFSCLFCPEKYGFIQALAGHQNAHRTKNLLQKRLSKAIQERTHENYMNGKKIRGNDLSHHHRYHHHHGDDDNVNIGNRGDGGHHLDIKGKNHSSSSNDDIIYFPTPLREIIPSDYNQVITRPRFFDQGNNNCKPSYGIFLSPKTVTDVIEVNDDYNDHGDELSLWGPQIPQPPPPPQAPCFSCRKSLAQTPTSKIHHHCSSLCKFTTACFLRQDANIDLNMSYAQHLQDHLPFPPGFGYDNLNTIYFKKAMGEDHYQAYIDLNLKL